MLNFSDFPFSPSAPPYMPWKMVNDYYASYADHFKLRPHIRFNTEVTKVEQAEDYELSGRWSVTSKTHDGNVVKETYDALMLCTGLFAKCNLPWYPGQDEFKGQILHSNEFRKGEDFVNKTVLVIGKVQHSNCLSGVYTIIHLLKNIIIHLYTMLMDKRMVMWIASPTNLNNVQHI